MDVKIVHPSYLNKYKILNEIIRGSSGTIYNVIYDENKYIMKKMHSHIRCRDNEYEKYKIINNECKTIPKVYEMFKIDKNIYIIFYYINGSLDLIDYVNTKRQKESKLTYTKKILKILIDVINAIIFLHQKNIIHFDIKPDNILVDIDGNGYLIDFDHSLNIDYKM